MPLPALVYSRASEYAIYLMAALPKLPLEELSSRYRPMVYIDTPSTNQKWRPLMCGPPFRASLADFAGGAPYALRQDQYTADREHDPADQPVERSVPDNCPATRINASTNRASALSSMNMPSERGAMFVFTLPLWANL
jgi:hypothetical protein